MSLLSLFDALKTRRYATIKLLKISLQGLELKGSSSRRPAMLGNVSDKEKIKMTKREFFNRFFPRSSFKDIFFAALFLGVFGTSILQVASLFGSFRWSFEIASNFQLQYLIIFFISFLLFVYSHRVWPAVYAGIFVLLSLVSVFSIFYVAPPLEHTSGNIPLRILYMNVYISNTSYDDIATYVKKVNPDAIVFVEVSPESYHAFKSSLSGIYTYDAYQPGDDKPAGIVFFSKVPPSSQENHRLRIGGMPVLRMTFGEGPERVALYGVHLNPPNDKGQMDKRNVELEELSRKVQGEQNRVIVVGDFNITPWSYYFKDFLKTSKLRDTRTFGRFTLSWHSSLPFFMRIPIDQALISRGIVLEKRSAGPSLGSDHLPVVLEIQY